MFRFYFTGSRHFKLFLEKVELKGKGTYFVDYYDLEKYYPNTGTFKMDQERYFNNKENNIISSMGNTDYGETIIEDSREPDFLSAR